jgi:Domain of unknown function (DUF4116)
VVLAALASSSEAVGFADPVLFWDKHFFREAAAVLREDVWALARFMDEELALEAVKVSPARVLAHLPGKLKACPRVWKAAVEVDVMALEHVPDDQCTREVVEAAIRRSPEVYVRLWRWISSRDMACLAVSLKGSLLGHPETMVRWKDDDDVVLAAVSQNGLALEFASERLKKSDRVLRAALRQNGLALAYAGERARRCDTYVKIAVHQNYYAIVFSRCCSKVEQEARERGARLPPLPAAPGDPWT